MRSGGPFKIEESARFTKWLEDLRDEQARVAVTERLRRFALGIFSDSKGVGGGVVEARVDIGPGYRVHYTLRGGRIVLLLCGGDKGSQARDISRARAMVEEMD